jgi:predicted secreted hydrolase
LSGQTWKQYPYQPEQSLLRFPDDEGFHPDELIEWWYINGHARGMVTGHDYSFMVAYFYEPVSWVDGFRIFSVCDETTGVYITQTRPCIYPVLDTDRLNLCCNIVGGNIETFTNDTNAGGDLIPFDYLLQVLSDSDTLNIRCSAQKPPLIVADSGFLYQGATGYSYYYSITDLLISGTLTFQGLSEEISGTAWIDRQFGSFNPYVGEDYEWLSVQLDNHVELNIWNIFTPEHTIPDSPAYRICSVVWADGTSFTTSDFTLERMKFAYTPDSERCYANGWKLKMKSQPIELIVNTLFSDHEVLLPFRFFEGSTAVQGFMDGLPVSGKGFAELIHAYERPEIRLVYPETGTAWDAGHALQWEVLNPDEGNILQFDVEIKNDKELYFNKIIQDYKSTSLVWNPSYFSPDSLITVRLTAYSADSSLNAQISSKVRIIPLTWEFETCSGDQISFPLSLQDPDLQFQWLKDGETLAGETASMLVLTGLQPYASGGYACIVRKPSFADTTLPFFLTVYDPFSMDENLILCEGDEFLGHLILPPGPLLITEPLLSVTGCDSIIHYHISVEPCTHTLRIPEESPVSIFPDHGQRCIVLQFSNAFSGNIGLFDMQGQCLGVETLSTVRNHVIPLSKVKSGVFLIKFSGSIEATHKLLFL